MNNKHIDLWSLPIKDQCYFILVGREGSWIYNALFDEMDDNEAFCQRVVRAYRDENPTPCDTVQYYLDESYDSIMAYRARKEQVVINAERNLPPFKVHLSIKK